MPKIHVHFQNYSKDKYSKQFKDKFQIYLYIEVFKINKYQSIFRILSKNFPENILKMFFQKTVQKHFQAGTKDHVIELTELDTSHSGED